MNDLGKRIRALRKARDWTQKQLAEGVCSQSLLSRIEQGTETPSVFIIYNLCQKLAITMDQLLDTEELSSPFMKLKKELFDLYQQNDYETLYTLLHKKIFSIFEAYHETTYYDFFLGITELAYKKNEESATIAFERAAANQADKSFCLLVNSYLAKIYAKQGQSIQALASLNHVLNLLTSIKINEKKYTLLPVIYHNLCISYMLLAQPFQAIEYVNLGLECCKLQRNNFQLTQLLFRSGQLFMMMNRKKTGMNRMNHAISLSELIDHPLITESFIKQKKNWEKICEYA